MTGGMKNSFTDWRSQGDGHFSDEARKNKLKDQLKACAELLAGNNSSILLPSDPKWSQAYQELLWMKRDSL